MKTIKEIFDTFNEEQKECVYAMVGYTEHDAYSRGYSDAQEDLSRLLNVSLDNRKNRKL